jgi:putative transposase
MAKKRMKPEQVVTLLRQIEVAVANGKTTAQACKDAEVTEQTYYRWRKEYGGLKLDQARRLKELEKENARLKRKNAFLRGSRPLSQKGECVDDDAADGQGFHGYQDIPACGMKRISMAS